MKVLASLLAASYLDNPISIDGIFDTLLVTGAPPQSSFNIVLVLQFTFMEFGEKHAVRIRILDSDAKVIWYMNETAEVEARPHPSHTYAVAYLNFHVTAQWHTAGEHFVCIDIDEQTIRQLSLNVQLQP